MPVYAPGRRNPLSRCRPWQKGMPCPALQGSQGSRSPKQWEPGPSAIAIGMMDSVLTMEKLLSDRVPPDSHARLGRRLTSLRRSVLHAIVGHDRFLHTLSPMRCTTYAGVWATEPLTGVAGRL
jgi:hypothetical protein